MLLDHVVSVMNRKCTVFYAQTGSCREYPVLRPDEHVILMTGKSVYEPDNMNVNEVYGDIALIIFIQ